MKKKNINKKRRHTGTTAMGKALLRAAHELEETLKAGIPLTEKYDVRKVSIPDPGKYAAKQVRALRARLGVSQAVFARLIGASTVLVSKWEQGSRNPDGMARRLMDEIASNPKRWMLSLIESSHKKAGGLTPSHLLLIHHPEDCTRCP